MRAASPLPIPVLSLIPTARATSHDQRPPRTPPSTAPSVPPRPLTFSRMPRAPEESARSLPARSTKLILLTWVRGKAGGEGVSEGQANGGTASKATGRSASDGESQERGRGGDRRRETHKTTGRVGDLSICSSIH